MQTGHWIALLGLALMLLGAPVPALGGPGFVVFIVGCYLCDPNKRAR